MPEDLTVMVIDTSARAHAVAESYLRSPNIKRVIVPEKNQLLKESGERQYEKEVILEEIDIKNPETTLRTARKHSPGLIDVCQDDALALGTVDLLQASGFPHTFGPTSPAARIESSKAWSRKLQRKNGIPHPPFHVFDNPTAAREAAEKMYGQDPNALRFWKANGLCGGKGAIPSINLDEALAAIEAMGGFGNAGKTFLHEEGLVGEEASLYTFVDKKGHTHTLRSSQDNKRQLNFDEGPNTGGMGVIRPARIIDSDPNLMSRIQQTIIDRTISSLAKAGTPYVGVLYSGVMIVDEKLGKNPYVVEFNARWGAPEAEVVVPGIMTPMDEIAMACIHGTLDGLQVKEDDKVRLCIVGASRGYPDSEAVKAVKGKEIFGLREAAELEGVSIYGAGVRVENGRFYADGGRLFSLTAEDLTVRDAARRALDAMALIRVRGNNLHYRTDIGWRDVERELTG